MSDYVERRLAEIEAGVGKRERLTARKRPASFESKAPRTSLPVIDLNNPVHIAAHQYVRRQRVGTARDATWFDVHDAFAAGMLYAKRYPRP